MKPVLRIAVLLLRADRLAIARGAVLSVVVLVMGAALLGLSGWFITATGLAGLAGIGIAFDVFRPSAGIRFLALGRAAARYGERLLTHDAMLRALAALRVVLLRGHQTSDARALMRLRGEAALTRIVADVDALDGLVLRLVLPAFAALVTHILVYVVLAWLLGWPVALVVFAGYVPVAVLIFWVLSRQSLGPSDEAEKAAQELSRGMIDMIRDRQALIMASQLSRKEDRLRRIDERSRAAARRLDASDRAAAFLFSVVVAFVAMGAFVIGARLLNAGQLGAAQAVIGFFVALALAEALHPLRRAISDLGRMAGAAHRVAPHTVPSPCSGAAAPETTGPLLTIDRPDGLLVFEAGETVVVTGPSGAGKSTLLMQIAGLYDDRAITIGGQRPTDWPEEMLRAMVTALPQRSALVTGTVRDNLSLAGDFSDERMWLALDAVALICDLADRGGLDTRLAEAGAGLSGGQARRLALARNLLKNPRILLLDEPTEGLDAITADAVLRGVRRFLPQTLIVVAMHRGTDHGLFGRTIALT